MANYKVKDIELAKEGRMLIEYAEKHMPVLMHLREKYAKEKPLKGMRIAGCLHVTKETAVLVETLQAAGAEVAWSGCNPLSTNDKVAAALAANDVPVYAWHGLNTEEYYWCIDQTLKMEPTLTLDDGADLIFTIHNKHQELIPKLYGGSEETTTGVIRVRAMADDGALKYPIMAVNDAETKHMFDNVYGTGQSSFDGVLRASAMDWSELIRWSPSSLSDTNCWQDCRHCRVWLLWSRSRNESEGPWCRCNCDRSRRGESTSGAHGWISGDADE